jgi:nitrogen regulatory protein PII
MKVITAFIKHFRVDEVCLALSKLDITGITITEVKGFGRPRGTEFFPGDESVLNFLPRIRLEADCGCNQSGSSHGANRGR